MPLSSEAQALFDHARQSLPRWLTGSANAALEWLYGFTETFEETRVQGQDWLDITLLDNASGAELDQHAADRNTSRRAGETDASLRERLRNISDAVTQPALIIGVDAILDGEGFLAKFETSTHTSTGWNSVLEAYDTLSAGGWQTGITLSMIDNGTNPPTMTEVESQDGKSMAVTINFDSGVTTRAAVEALMITGSVFDVLTASDSGASVLTADDAFTDKHFYLSGFVNLRRDRAHMHAAGDSTAFLGRGYRMTRNGRPMGYVFILPYGTTAATASAVSEYLRKNGPGGYVYYVERRLTP